jgi:hypothetical protein
MRRSLFAIGCLSMALTACGQPVQETAASAEPANDQSETEPMNPSVRAALDVVPAARPYVDAQNGDFDYDAARSDLGAINARELRTVWNVVLSEARANS